MGKHSSKTCREIPSMGNHHQLSGILCWVLLPNLHHTLQEEHQIAKHLSATRQLMPRHFSQEMQSLCLLLDSMQYQFSRDVVSGHSLVSGHVRTQSVFFLNISSVDEAEVPPNVPTPPDVLCCLVCLRKACGSRQVGVSLPAQCLTLCASPNRALHLRSTVLPPSIKYYLWYLEILVKAP